MPQIIDATVVNQAYSTSGNGGRKLVRLSNGNLFSVVKLSTGFYLYKTTNDWTTSELLYSHTAYSSFQDVCLETDGNYIYMLMTYNNSNARVAILDDNGYLNSVTIDSSQSAMNNVSLAINEQGTELHATWSSKNSSYPNSFNIRYAKGTFSATKHYEKFIIWASFNIKEFIGRVSFFMDDAGEQLLTDMVSYISTLVPVHVEKTRNELSVITNRYHIQRVELNQVHPDLMEKITLFLASKKLEGLSVSTLDSYKLELRIFADNVKKHTKDITTSDIRVFLSQFPHLKMSSVSRKLSVLKSFFGWLASEDIIQRDPTAKLKPPKEEKRLPKSLSIEELELLRESCKTTRQRAFLEVLYATGCRLSEIHQLNISDVNTQTMSCNVIGKGDKEREVYFSYKAMYHLKKYLDARKDNEKPLFITERKPYRRLSKRGIQREIKKIAENAGLENKVHPHVLRHTFATLTLNNGAELVAIQELLGHSSPDTTLRYARITEERKREQHKKYLVQ